MKTKIAAFTIAALAALLALSVWKIAGMRQEKEMARQYLLNAVFSSFMNISRELDGLIPDLEKDIPFNDAQRDTLLYVSDELNRAHTLLMQYHSSTFSGLYYGGGYGLDYLSHTLGYGQGVSNGVSWCGILADNAVSENERSYLIALRDDIGVILTKITSPDNPLGENEDLTISQLNTTLAGFFDTWSRHNEESPYFLLESG